MQIKLPKSLENQLQNIEREANYELYLHTLEREEQDFDFSEKEHISFINDLQERKVIKQKIGLTMTMVALFLVGVISSQLIPNELISKALLVVSLFVLLGIITLSYQLISDKSSVK